MRLEMHGTHETALMGLTHLIELARSATSGLNGSVQLLSLVGCRAVSAPWVVHRAQSCCARVLLHGYYLAWAVRVQPRGPRAGRPPWGEACACA